MIKAVLLFSIASLAGLVAFRFQKQIKPYINLVLSFSGAYLLSICFLHLLPELFQGNSGQFGLFILVGFFLQLILDYFSGGIEHGHTHVNHKRIGKFPYLVLLSLCLHAFLESLPIFHVDSHHPGNDYLLGLLVHKAPIAFILCSLLLAYRVSKIMILFGILLFALTAPLGFYLGAELQFDSQLFQHLFALSIGIILHLSTTILLETNEEHKVSWKKVIPMLLGAATGLLTLLIH